MAPAHRARHVPVRTPPDRRRDGYDGRYRAALASGNPGWRPLSTDFADADAVILATGYRPNVSYLAGTGALDDAGEPRHRRGVSTTVEGLGYVGLSFQRSFASATVRGVARDARHELGRLRRLPSVTSGSHRRATPSIECRRWS